MQRAGKGARRTSSHHDCLPGSSSSSSLAVLRRSIINGHELPDAEGTKHHAGYSEAALILWVRTPEQRHPEGTAAGHDEAAIGLQRTPA